MARRIGVGFVGSGFIARFHARSWVGVRDGDIVAVASPNPQSRKEFAELCRELGVGEVAGYDDVAAMVRQSDVEAVWITAPNHVRVPLVQAIVDEVRAGRSKVRAIAIEKPLARNVAEARKLVEMVEGAGLLHAYLENQVFAPSLTRGKEIAWRRGAALSGTPYLARAAEEHGGPHRPWFWRGPLQGGGVLSDMMCHSVEAGRYMLTPPDRPDYLRPVAVTASIANLKWSRPRYAELLRRQTGGEVDYGRAPAEDYASAEIVYETADGDLVITQANTSWSFSGAGLRLTFELLGPEYSLSINTLEPESKIFFSRNVQGPAGEDLVEKQAAEQGQMPYLGDEAHVYGYTAENQHVTAAFAQGRMPRETLRDGLLVTQLLMAAYRAAEAGMTMRFAPDNLDEFVPLVQQDRWSPRQIAERAH
ncbi:Gfo/Idh/MocA family oxidoreductase [Carboxydochorda subterranea]|uniref:Gfo/Idh/MocA family oxidoreductase n=1 Tax=Carboxydichorda subterranea TaxID=3109565 RepID=A0ABZ1BY83_9FIRM|nr:Gfo/Idh/MocA family oxidoreductase [Limnochorda sp. L945t]WRP17047.1 Gfo/Idh/MocA family oxidoreductase [Limnochorda sp. L945t]